MTTASYPGDLTGKIIVVTGGAQGIGGAAAQLCAARGGTVIIADWKADTGQQAAHAIQAAGHCASFIQVDVCDAAAVESLMAQVQAHLMSHQYEGLLKKANLKGHGRRG